VLNLSRNNYVLPQDGRRVVTASLKNALAINSRLRELDCGYLTCVTFMGMGWQTFSSILQDPASALDKLDLIFYRMIDVNSPPPN
jgi:hypothetical protein